MKNHMNIQVMGLNELRERLGHLAPQAKTVARMAVNDTAMNARKLLNDEARKRYKVKKTKFNKSLSLSRATNATLTATLSSKGRPLPLSYFEIRKNGKRKAGQGHQLQSTSLTPLSKNGNKAFVAKVKGTNQSGAEYSHRGLFYRPTDKPFPILQIYGSSVPAMVGSPYVYGKLEPAIHEKLQDNLQRHIDMVLRRG